MKKFEQKKFDEKFLSKKFSTKKIFEKKVDNKSPKKWIKREMDQNMDRTETLDYNDEYTAHLIGLELSFNLDR